MTEFENLAAATAALEAAGQKDAAEKQSNLGSSFNQDNSTTVAPQNTDTNVGNNQADDPLASLGIDLSTLSDDDRQKIKDGFLRREDYTQKTQEAAELRKQYEAYGDPSDVQKAVEFFKNYDSNPVYALQTANHARETIRNMVDTGQIRREDLGSLAESLGFDEQSSTVNNDDTVIVDYTQLPKEVRDKLAKVDQLEARFDTKDQRDLENMYTKQIENDLSELRTEHPEWDFDAEDKEGAAIFAIASSDPNMGLKQAATIFTNATNHRVEVEREAYLKAKQEQALLPNSPNGGAGGSVTPQQYSGIRDPKLLKAALARLNAETSGL